MLLIEFPLQGRYLGGKLASHGRLHVGSAKFQIFQHTTSFHSIGELAKFFIKIELVGTFALLKLHLTIDHNVAYLYFQMTSSMTFISSCVLKNLPGFLGMSSLAWCIIFSDPW